MQSITVQRLSDLTRELAATGSRLEKQAKIAHVLQNLASTDALRLVRFLSGHALPAGDPRVTGVSAATVVKALVRGLGVDAKALREASRRKGELSSAAEELLGLGGASTSEGPTLVELEASFDRMAACSRPSAKEQELTHLLRSCANGAQVAQICRILLSEPRTGVREGVLEGAIAQSAGVTPEALRRGTLLTGGLEPAAQLAFSGELDAASFVMFRPIEFMLATPRVTPDQISAALAGRKWFAQDKLDGVRVQLHVAGGSVQLFTRAMGRIDGSFPEITRPMESASESFVLDGEIVPWDGSRVLPFARLQRRLGRASPDPQVIAAHPVILFAFDLLVHEGRLMVEEPMEVRWRELEALAMRNDLRLVPSVMVDSAPSIEQAFENAKRRGNEGIVVKDPASAYSTGRRGGAWIKLKSHLPTLDCVVTRAEYGHGKRRGVLSDYTFAVWDRSPSEPGATLLPVGKAYSGLTDAEIAQLTEIFLADARTPVGRWIDVRPRIVLEIAFDQVRRSRRHPSGVALRFPRIKRIRWDKPPEDADRLARVEELLEHPSNTARERDWTPAAPSGARTTVARRRRGGDDPQMLLFG
jgi:DNA ligase-1